MIESLELKEIQLSGRQYTWVSRRDTPTYEKLDRVLTNVEWEQKFPRVTVRTLERAGSDHTPLLLDSGEQAHLGNKSHFSFELSWLRHEGFVDMINAVWNSVSHGTTVLERWQNKIRHLRSYLRGWAKNLSGVYKKEKHRLLSIIESLEAKADLNGLDSSERTTLVDVNSKLALLRRDEEAKWAQRAKVKHIQEGGNNTKYFHMIANGKHRRKRIFQLEQDDGTIVGQQNLKVYITEFYKKLFGAPE